MWLLRDYRDWPTADDLTHERRILHPLLDDLAIHLHTNEQTGQLQALTATDHFHITTLCLNRPQLVKARLSRQWQQMLQEKQHLLQAQLDELRKTIRAQEQYLAILQAQIDELRSAQ